MGWWRQATSRHGANSLAGNSARTDIEYVANRVGVDLIKVRVDVYSRETYARHQRTILHYFGCCPFDKAARRFTVSEIAALVRVQFTGISRCRTCRAPMTASFALLQDEPAEHLLEGISSQ
jgi:hypothetical protein